MRNKIFIIMTFFIGILIVTLFASMLFLQKRTITFLTTTKLEKQTTQKIKFFNSFLEHRVQLVNAISSNSEFINYVKTNKNKNIVQNLFITQANTHFDMFQLRFIDSKGFEKVRIDNYNTPRLLDSKELQNKKNRYYFVDTMKLNKEELYFSNFDLNVERGRIETAYIPTLRIAKPIVIENKTYGILIINLNLSEFLNQFREMSLHNMTLFYGDGNIIIDKNNKYSWSRDFKIKTKVNDLYTFLPKDMASFKEKRYENFYIEKLPINTKNSIYILITPKEFKRFDVLYDYIKENIYLFITFSFLGVLFSFFISKYIEKLFRRRMVFEKVKNNNILINSVINSTHDLIFYKDEKLNYIGCNKAFLWFCHKKESEVIGANDFEILDIKLATMINEMDHKVLETNEIFVEEEWITYNDKNLFYQFKSIPFEYGNDLETGVLTIANDITQLQKEKEKLQEESFKDPLTNAYNRKAFDESIEDRLELYKRYEDIFCIAMLDIDNFKLLNDTYGHDCGDRVLINMVELINTTTRKSDTLFRVGGEEFVIIFPKTNLENAHVILEKVRLAISEFSFIENKNVTISCGLTQASKDDDSVKIYKRVDELLYKTKNSGKNGITVCSEDLVYEI